MPEAPVIYVEDDRDDVFFMQHAFKVAGITQALFILVNGQQVIDYLAGSGCYADREKYPLPCLLLLDLKLPLKNGFEVLAWMRAQSLTAVKVVVVSSSAQASDVGLARELGAVEYVVKPSSPAKLVQVVRRLQADWLG